MCVTLGTSVCMFGKPQLKQLHTTAALPVSLFNHVFLFPCHKGINWSLIINSHAHICLAWCNSKKSYAMRVLSSAISVDCDVEKTACVSGQQLVCLSTSGDVCSTSLCLVWSHFMLMCCWTGLWLNPCVLYSLEVRGYSWRYSVVSQLFTNFMKTNNELIPFV